MMKNRELRQRFVVSSIVFVFATISFVACEQRDDLNEFTHTKYSKTITFSEQVASTRSSAHQEDLQSLADTYVLRSIDSAIDDSLFITSYVSNIDDEYLTRASEYTSIDNEFNIIAVGGPTNLSTVVERQEGSSVWEYNPSINWSALGNSTVQFYAYDNFPSSGFTLISGSSIKYDFTIDNNMTDIVTAKASQTYTATANANIPLPFKHIFAQIQFVTGSRTGITSGNNFRITSIQLQGTYLKGQYDFDYGFTLDPSSNVTNEQPSTLSVKNIGTNINNVAEGTALGEPLMVIPQTLSGGIAQFKIGYKLSDNDTEKFLYAAINVTWEPGRKYTYRITNHKVDLLSFVDPPAVVDAHYIIQPIKVRLDAREVALNNCRLEEYSGKDYTPCGITMRYKDDLNLYESQGFWIGNEGLGFTSNNVSFPKRDNYYSIGNIEKGDGNIVEKTIYLFIPENTTGANRDVKLKLSAGDDRVEVLTITQFCPHPETGCERIEEEPVLCAWGPYWKFTPEGQTSITYEIPADKRNGWEYFKLQAEGYIKNSDFLFWIFSTFFDWEKTEGVTYNFSRTTLVSVTLDYKNYLTFTTTGSGLSNTQLIYNGSNTIDLSSLVAVENSLLALDAIQTTNVVVDRIDSDNSAFILTVKKNKFTIKHKSASGQDAVDILIDNNDIKWYLPSISEMRDNIVLKSANEAGEDAIQGVYWSSTTSTANDKKSSHSFAYNSANPSEDVQTERSHEGYKFRAVRVR